MFIAKNNANEYVSVEPRGMSNAPRVVARFPNETIFRTYMRDNHHDVKGNFSLVNLDNGKDTEVVL